MSKPLMKYIRGFAFPNADRFTVENITDALDHVPDDGDIVLCSFPKAGTTWMQSIIWQILNKGMPYPPLKEFTFRLAPFIERVGTEPVKSQSPPRFCKNHLPYHAMKINKMAKYVYIYRHPADTLVSYYHFLRNTGDCDMDIEQFFKNFLEGATPYGDYLDHVLSFYKHKNERHLLLVSYEDMQWDKRGQLLRVAEFLGESYYKGLVDDEVLLQKTLELTSFEYMKKNLTMAVMSKDARPGESKKVDLFRKGIVGDGNSTLTDFMRNELQKMVFDKMDGTDLANVWKF